MSAGDCFVDVDGMDESFLEMEMEVKVEGEKKENELEDGENFDLVEDFEELIEDRTQKSVSPVVINSQMDVGAVGEQNDKGDEQPVNNEEVIKKALTTLTPSELKQIEDYANFCMNFRTRRTALGLQQFEIANYITQHYKFALSQTTVSRFEALTLNFNITKKLIPLFVQLLEDVDQAIATGNSLRIGNKAYHYVTQIVGDDWHVDNANDQGYGPNSRNLFNTNQLIGPGKKFLHLFETLLILDVDIPEMKQQLITAHCDVESRRPIVINPEDLIDPGFSDSMQVATFEEVVAEERKFEKSLTMQPGISEMEKREFDPQGQIDEDLMEFFVVDKIGGKSKEGLALTSAGPSDSIDDEMLLEEDRRSRSVSPVVVRPQLPAPIPPTTRPKPVHSAPSASISATTSSAFLATNFPAFIVYAPNMPVVTRKRRTRTILDEKQVEVMEKEFALIQNPFSEDVERIGNQLGLEKDVVKVWFANRRQKAARALRGRRKSSDLLGVANSILQSIVCPTKVVKEEQREQKVVRRKYRRKGQSKIDLPDDLRDCYNEFFKD
ncbi:hypothetical protein WR25_05150 [Diploscapter pachys]|uniref:Homeobox domain-containing protein n=1 Tax=Diploscapter pachys TaxID=2018661 RepID=A0A2A2JZT9_9BILA|nr:hypothetical protein WR25_05150 [Diploscapter pachys]